MNLKIYFPEKNEFNRAIKFSVAIKTKLMYAFNTTICNIKGTLCIIEKKSSK